MLLLYSLKNLVLLKQLCHYMGTKCWTYAILLPVNIHVNPKFMNHIKSIKLDKAIINIYSV